MKYWLLSVACSALVLCSISSLLSLEKELEESGKAISRDAQSVLNLLNLDQQKLALLSFSSEQRTNWNFVPLDTRKGLPLSEMTKEQRAAVNTLLASALSETGVAKTQQIIRLENLLQTLEGPERRWPRDPEMYYLTIYGDPSSKAPWGMSFEGHHLSLNFVIQGNSVTATTPQFMGSNPGRVQTDEIQGLPADGRVLSDEEQLGFDLLASLNNDERQTAIISSEAPREVRGANSPQPPQDAPQGLHAANMSGEQQRILKLLLSAYIGTMPRDVAARRWESIEEAGFGNVQFAWLGAEEPGIGHAYRVQGPTFLVELVNTQPDAEGNPANHVHSIWRDMRGDFGIPIQ